MVTSVFCTLRCPRIRSWPHWKEGQPKTSCSQLFDLSIPFQHFQRVSLGRCVSVMMSRTTARSREVLIILSLFVVTTPHHRCSDGMGSRGFRWSSAYNLGVVARGENCTLTSTRTSHCKCTESRSGYSRHVSVSGSSDVLDYEVSPANSYCSAKSHTYSTYSFSRADCPLAPSHQRAGDVAGHESFLAFGNRGALSILDAGVVLGCRGTTVNCAHGTESIWRKSPSSPK